MMKKLILLTGFVLTIASNAVYAQDVLLSELHFESLQEITNAGGVTSGSIALVPGPSGNAINMENAASLCFPAANMINAAKGTLQFWVKDIVPNSGLWQITNLGSNKFWGTYRIYDNGGPAIVETLNYELQTAAGTSTTSSGNWRQDTTWHFVVFTWSKGSSRTSFTIFVDGIRYGTPDLLGFVNLTAGSMLCLGQYATWANSRPKIDELKTFNYVRSQTQINSDFSQLFSGCPIWQYLWRNNLNPNDVNRDGIVNINDALYVLSAIASGVTYNFTVCPNGLLPALALDVVGNNILNQQDASAVVSAINATLPPAQQINIQNLTNLSHGDVDSNGTLNQDDIIFMVNNMGLSVPPFTQGDITGDGMIDRNDLDILRKYTSTEGEWRSLLPLFKIVRP